MTSFFRRENHSIFKCINKDVIYTLFILLVRMPSVMKYLFATRVKELQSNIKLLKKKLTKMTYLKTLHLKIQRGRDDITQVWIDLIFIMVPWGMRRTRVN